MVPTSLGLERVATNRWVTRLPQVAARLRAYADESAERELKRTFLHHAPWPGRIPHPPQERLEAYQEPAARFLLERNRAYLAADPGLGKTIIAALYLNALAEALRFYPFTVVVVPPSLAVDFKTKVSRWLIGKRRVEIYSAKYKGGADVLIMPDSLLHTRRARRAAFGPARLSLEPVLIVDEAHRFKSPEARRTQMLFGQYVPEFSRVVLMSGSPMPNFRPMELYPALNACAPETISFMDLHSFGLKYCGATWSGREWEYKGATKMGELGKRVIGPFMTRLKKADHLKHLPTKRDELVFIGEDLPHRVGELDRKLLREYSPTDLMGEKLAKSGHVSTYLRELGLVKVAPALRYFRELLEDPAEVLIIFAYHPEVIERLAQGLKKYRPIVLDAKVPRDKRWALTHRFQRDPKRRVIILSRKVGAEGYDLTKACRVIHVEPSFSPGENDQAGDRAHRIGQLRDVLNQYLVFVNSMDRRVMESNLRKRETYKPFDERENETMSAKLKATIHVEGTREQIAGQLLDHVALYNGNGTPLKKSKAKAAEEEEEEETEEEPETEEEEEEETEEEPETEEEETEEEPELDHDTVAKAFQKYAKKNGEAKALAKLKKFGVASVRKLPVKKLPEVMASLAK